MYAFCPRRMQLRQTNSLGACAFSSGFPKPKTTVSSPNVSCSSAMAGIDPPPRENSSYRPYRVVNTNRVADIPILDLPNFEGSLGS